MKNKKIKNLTLVILLISGISFISFGFLSDDKSGNKPLRPSYKLNDVQQSGKNGDAYRLFVNNINLPMNRTGVMADVDIPPDGSGGKFKGDNGFLFSSGFFLSGFSDGQLWTNAVASASLVEDYRSGRAIPGPDDDAQMYVLSSQDPDFGPSWEDWRDAVVLGADFYDGNGDGVYDPKDINGNGQWDPESVPGAMDGEDRPDLIGDETVWCVYHDGLPQAQRRWDTVPPYGIEVRQTAFAFASAGAIGNIIFVRYRIKYVGLNNPNEADHMTNVYFGAWADPDNGDFENDVVGVDTTRNAGFTYDNQTDDVWGDQPPCFMIDFFSGPRAYIPGETFIDDNGNGEYDDGVDTPLDTARSSRGQVIGVKEFPGAKNLPVSSFVLYLNGVNNLDDPGTKEQARNYMEGSDLLGVRPDPCTFAFGAVFGGVDCNAVDPRFWFSGDPVTNTGWICTINEDVRQMTNAGPFVLNKNEENEIVVAYVVGQGTSPLDAITVARTIDDGAQEIFDQNFLAPQPPPPPQFTLTTGENFIDILWDTPDQISYTNQTPSWDLFFSQYQIWAFQTNSSADLVSGVPNSQLITTYQIQNFIKDIYIEDSPITGTGGRFLNYPEADNKLDSAVYVDPEKGRIRYRVFIDPFTNTPITKGKPYYFSVISTAINYRALRPYVEKGDSNYYLAWDAFSQATENIKVVSAVISEVDSYDPNVLVQPANSISGASTGRVGYDVIYKDSLRTSQYEVSFFKDSSSQLYQMYWRMQNLNTGALLVDSSLSYLYGEPAVDVKITEGFITKVEDAHPTFGTPVYTGAQWFTNFYDPSDAAATDDGTGVAYVGRDILQGKKLVNFPSRCEIITGDRLRRVELRFDSQAGGKAYRYINGYLSTFARNTYRYAAQLGPADTVGKGPIGNWDDVNDRANGWVDVPFTAWVVDERFGTEQQLAVGYVERARNTVYPNGSPDGVWDPTTNLLASGEIILIFDYPYDPNGGANPFDPNSGGQIQFTGGAFSTPGGEEFVWADIPKTAGSAKDAPADATNITDEQRVIFNSSWFNTMYTVGLQRADESSFFADGDVLEIPVTVYPYTENDVYQFALDGTTITAEEQQNLWNNLTVFPNPLFGFNQYTGYLNEPPDDPWVTFTNLPPTEITIRIYSLSGTLVRTLTQDDRDQENSPYLRWDLKNDAELRVGSGMYLAIVTSPQYGDKVLKLAVIMPQKQIQRF